MFRAEYASPFAADTGWIEEATLTSPSRFQGFPEGTFRFLRDIAANNTRAWFETNRSEYERYYLDPAIAFVERSGTPRSCRIRWSA